MILRNNTLNDQTNLGCVKLDHNCVIRLVLEITNAVVVVTNAMFKVNESKRRIARWLSARGPSYFKEYLKLLTKLGLG